MHAYIQTFNYSLYEGAPARGRGRGCKEALGKSHETPKWDPARIMQEKGYVGVVGAKSLGVRLFPIDMGTSKGSCKDYVSLKRGLRKVGECISCTVAVSAWAIRSGRWIQDMV